MLQFKFNFFGYNKLAASFYRPKKTEMDLQNLVSKCESLSIHLEKKEHLCEHALNEEGNLLKSGCEILEKDPSLEIDDCDLYIESTLFGNKLMQFARWLDLLIKKHIAICSEINSCKHQLYRAPPFVDTIPDNSISKNDKDQKVSRGDDFVSLYSAQRCIMLFYFNKKYI